MADDISDLDLDNKHGHQFRRLRAADRQRKVARYVMLLGLDGWMQATAVRAAMREFKVPRSAIFEALKQQRAAVEREAYYLMRRKLSGVVRRVLRLPENSD